MAKIDEIKEIVGFLKVLFATFVALDVSLVAWISKNHLNNDLEMNILVLFLILLFSIGIVSSVRAILTNIRKLKDL